MRVVAVALGFYKGSRRRPGEVFEMPEADARLPRWVQPANDPLPEAKSEHAKTVDAVIASAGPKKVGTPPPKIVGDDEDLV